MILTDSFSATSLSTIFSPIVARNVVSTQNEAAESWSAEKEDKEHTILSPPFIQINLSERSENAQPNTSTPESPNRSSIIVLKETEKIVLNENDATVILNNEETSASRSLWQKEKLKDIFKKNSEDYLEQMFGYSNFDSKKYLKNVSFDEDHLKSLSKDNQVAQTIALNHQGKSNKKTSILKEIKSAGRSSISSTRREQKLEFIAEETEYPSDIDFLDDISSSVGMKFRQSKEMTPPQDSPNMRNQNIPPNVRKMTYQALHQKNERHYPLNYGPTLTYVETRSGATGRFMTNESKKRPYLITNLNFTTPSSTFQHIAIENKMIYNPQRKCWEGNDEQLEDFENINTLYTLKHNLSRQSPYNLLETTSDLLKTKKNTDIQHVSKSMETSIPKEKNNTKQLEHKAVQSSFIVEVESENNMSSENSFAQIVLSLSNHQDVYLDISHKELHHIPNLNEIMPFLKTLDANSNLIVSIGILPEGLTSLFLGNNRIRSPDFLHYLKNLIRLDLQSNHIEQINFISHLTNLEILNLDNNDIQDIHFLGHLHSLKELSIARNKLHHIRLNQSNYSLQKLNLTMNHLVNVRGIELLPNLMELYIDSNSLYEFKITGVLKLLKKLNIGFNRLTEFDTNTIPEIETLFLDNNAFKWYKNNSKQIINFSHAHRLNCLSLNGNDLRHHNMILPSSLSTLYIERCMIKQFPTSLISNCPNLKRLFLQQNNIVEIQDLLPTNQLEILDLYDNQLNDLKSLLTHFQALQCIKVLDLR